MTPDLWALLACLVFLWITAAAGAIRDRITDRGRADQ